MSRSKTVSLFPLSAAVIAVLVVVAFYSRSADFAGAQPAVPSTDSAYRELETKIDTFFSDLSTATTPSTEPFKELLKGGPLGGETELFATMSQNFANTKPFGAYRNHEQIAVREIGKSKDLVIMRYLYKCEHHPIVWYFTFYRTPAPKSTGTSTGGATSGNWFVIGVRFDSNLEGL